MPVIIPNGQPVTAKHPIDALRGSGATTTLEADALGQVKTVLAQLGDAAQAKVGPLLDGTGDLATKAESIWKELDATQRSFLRAALKTTSGPARAFLEAVSAADPVPGATDVIVKPGAAAAQPPVAKPVTTTTAGGRGSVLGLQIATLKQRPLPQDVAKDAADAIEKEARRFGDRKGVGMEHYGTGDPDIMRRRLLVLQLMDVPDEWKTGVLNEAWAQTDAAMLQRFERRDTTPPITAVMEEAAAVLEKAGADTTAKEIRKALTTGKTIELNSLANKIWSAKTGAKNPTLVENYYWALVLDERMDRNLKVNAKKAEEAAKGLADGTKTFFEVDHQRFSTQVLTRIEDPALRANTLGDILLQFRTPINKNTEFTQDTAGGSGVQSVREMREVAAKLDLSKTDDTALREQALTRAVALANPVSSSNAVLEARHLIGKLRRMSWELVFGEGAKQSGFWTNPYEAIHHNFSVETPKLIAAFTGQTVFGGGSPRTFCGLVDALGMFIKGDEAGGERALNETLRRDNPIAKALALYQADHPDAAENKAKLLESFLVSRCKGRLDSRGIGEGTLTNTERSHLQQGKVETVKGEYPAKLELVSRLYRTVCETLPNDKTLEENLFSALGARNAVADVITHLRSPDAAPVTTLKAITLAREALKAELEKHPEGFARINLWSLDHQLEALSSTYLGTMVDAIGEVKTPEQMNDAMASMQFALEGAILSGLDKIKDFNDPLANKGPTLAESLADIKALFAKGEVDLGTYQATMARSYEAIVRATENIRSFFDDRIPEVSEGKLIPNPAFLDDLIKEGPLHYARAIGQKALKVGLEAEMSPTKIVNPDGVSVLNALGRVVFDRIILAEGMSDLKELGAGRGDMCWVKKMDEKKMMAVGGIMSNFPGGYCHAAVYARGAGIAALSNPELSEKWLEFANNLSGDKLYYDDSGGRIVMMPLKEAQKQGLVKAGEEDKLKPGTNRNVKYMSWNEATKAYDTIGTHKVVVDLERSTDIVELYGTSSEIMGKGSKCMSFEEISELGTAARALVGEKSLVLGIMSKEPAVAKYVPPGSAISTLRVQKLLDDAGVLSKWVDVWDKDPTVGKITDDNFLESKFYTDGKFRDEKRVEMNKLVHEEVGKLLLNPDGTPTEKGKELLDELKANAKLAECENWIVRSSFTAEDRPGKSGAGQYDSFPNCRTDKERLEGVIGVIASAWEPPPVENNVREEYNLSRIWPAITVMKCLEPEFSGVMVSRDTDTSQRRTASYQSVKGFGGGVEDGVTEQGRIREGGKNEIQHLIKGEEKSLVDDNMAKALWTVAMEAERIFHRKIEPKRGFAVDMEWAVEKGQLYLVQARTIKV